MQDNSRLDNLKISDILPNRFQPRIKFDDEALNQLSASITRFGVIEPIVVRPIGNKYEIIAGERRFKASKLAGKSTIPCIIVNLSDKDSEELALLENVQRKSLSPIEEAVSYKRILDSGHISRDELSKKIGKPQSLIFSKIKLLDLDDEVQSYLLDSKISERHARSLLRLVSLSDQRYMLHRIVDERLTVKATDREIDKLLKGMNKTDNKVEDVTETLFDDERGKEKMDIDKIMQEAKDINAVENQNVVSAPNLMETGKDIANELIGGQDNSSVAVEPGKFVNTIPQTDTKANMNAAIDNGVTFDNMFASSNVDLSSNVNNTTQDNSGLDNTQDLNTLMSGVTPLIQPTLTPAPDLITPMGDNNSVDSQNGMGSPELNNLGGGIIPNSYNGVSNNEVSTIPEVSVSDINNPFNMEQPTIPEAPIPNMGQVNMEQPTIPETSIPNMGQVNMEQPTIPETSIPNMGQVNMEQPTISETSIPNMGQVNMEQPTISETSIPNMGQVNMEQPTVSETSIPNMGQVNMEQPTIPETSIPNMGQVNMERPNADIQDTTINNGGQSISEAVSDAFKQVNIPDVNIYQDPQADVSQAPMDNAYVQPSSAQNIITESPSVPNFVKVINMLRNCADEIQKSGFYINVEEMDVDGKYKVIFTIDKE